MAVENHVNAVVAAGIRGFLELVNWRSPCDERQF